MFGLSGIGLKIAITVIIVTIITASIGGFFMYHKSIINDFQDIIAEKDGTINIQKEQIAGLIIDKEKLDLSNKSLESEINRISEETANAFEELTRLRQKDIESIARVNEVERLLRDKGRIDSIQAIRNTTKASLLLRLMDRYVKCYTENFEKVKGKCIRGVWVPTGERLVPKSPLEDKQ